MLFLWMCAPKYFIKWRNFPCIWQLSLVSALLNSAKNRKISLVSASLVCGRHCIINQTFCDGWNITVGSGLNVSDIIWVLMNQFLRIFHFLLVCYLLFLTLYFLENGGTRRRVEEVVSRRVGRSSKFAEKCCQRSTGQIGRSSEATPTGVHNGTTNERRQQHATRRSQKTSHESCQKEQIQNFYNRFLKYFLYPVPDLLWRSVTRRWNYYCWPLSAN